MNLAQTVPLPQDPPPIGTEWDESFGDPSDATKRAEVHTAWNEAIRLAGMARDGIQDLRNSLNSQGFAPNEEDKARNFIVEQSQPWVFPRCFARSFWLTILSRMTQMFGPDRALLEEVQGVYEKMLNSIPNLQAPDRNGNVLRLALGSSIKKKNGKTPVCGTKADIEDEGLIYAFTNLPDMTDEIPNDLQLRYRFADSMIVFCPAFFQESADAMETDADALNNQRMLDGLRTPGKRDKVIASPRELIKWTGQTIVHEWAHLTWIKGANANGQDETYGYEQCAELVQKPDENNKNVARNNADNWAVLASYQAYNQEPWAPTGKASGCKDVWPRDGQGNYDPPKVN